MVDREVSTYFLVMLLFRPAMQMNSSEKVYFLKSLGAQIAKVRHRKGISSSDLARRTDSDTSLISRIERGRTNPTSITLKLICDALEISFEELFKGFGKKPRKEQDRK